MSRTKIYFNDEAWRTTLSAAASDPSLLILGGTISLRDESGRSATPSVSRISLGRSLKADFSLIPTRHFV